MSTSTAFDDEQSDSAMAEFVSWDWIQMNVGIWRSLPFVHIITRFREVDAEDRRCGHTLWVAEVGTIRIGLAWEWIESERGSWCFLPSEEDLMTNAVLIDELGLEFGERQRRPELLARTASLPWHQLAVARTMAAMH